MTVLKFLRCALQRHGSLKKHYFNHLASYWALTSTPGRHTQIDQAPPVEAIEPGQSPLHVWEAETPGFGLKVLPRGQCRYVAKYWVGGGVAPGNAGS